MRKMFEVFWFVLKCTLVGFGGGNALMPVIKREAVDHKNWINEKDFDDLVITTNMLPGPSVIEALAFISIKVLGKWKGTLVVLLGLLPHLFIPLTLYILGTKFLPLEWLFALNIAITPVIIGMILAFAWRYIVKSKNELSWPLGLALLIFTVIFSLFVPSPWNISAFVMIGVIILVPLIGYIKDKRASKKAGDK